MNETALPPHQEILCQQVLMDDSSVFSVQWTIVPTRQATGISADFLLERYLAYIRRFTLSIIRPVATAGGVEFRLLDTTTSLISFTGPIRREEGGEVSLTLHICGGFLVQPDQCHRGELAFLVEDTGYGARLTLRLADFCPLILGSSRPSRPRKWLYRFTQAYIHKVVTVRFLARVYRELAGGAACVRVVKATVRRGEEL
ncbi:MAG: hypothetical protein ED859_02260 [Desulfuromonadales bacterium]|nr:MAG: hypothetical protein ED859_02260 [Desulfuromonadales bacterium]